MRGQATRLLLWCALSLLACTAATGRAQQHALVNCRPIGERTQPEGCWIVASKPMGKFSAGPVYWTLDAYATRKSAEDASTRNSAVVEALGKLWVFSVGEKPPLPTQGTRVAQIGPLPVKPDEAYTAQFMEGILEPGSVSRTHLHAGPEAFYTETGESCLETPAGRQVGRKGTDIMVPEGTPMELTATGNETRRGIALVLHSSDKAAITMVSDWKAKGLCSVARE